MLERSASFDKGEFQSVLMVGTDGIVYNHELAGVRPEEQTYVETGPIELGNGDTTMAVRRVFTDYETVGDADMYLITSQYPNGPRTEYGPFDPTINPVPTTGVRGREIRMKLVPRVTGWKIGTQRFDVAPSGRSRR